jgi:hypothetical protein
MNPAGLVKYVSALVALALCAACSGAVRQAQGDAAGAPSIPTLDYRYVGRTLSVNGRLVTAARSNPMPRFATMLPDRIPSARKYEYIINDYGTYAGIFDYPKSTQEVGKITDVGGQGCTNVLYGYGKKTFWIVAADNQIAEYRVPKKLLRTISDFVGMPSSCAMNTHGDLAVGILVGADEGDVVIYKNATGSGTPMASGLGEEFFDGYDGEGNLFADGFNDSGFFTLVELPHGSGKFQTIATSNTVDFPGSVQWDGTYLTVVDQEVNAIYRYSVDGTKATLKGTVSLQGAGDCAQTWIVKGLVYCADAGNNDGEVFAYPAGSMIATFTGSFDLPLGTVAAER